jgi:hypothetical protein
MAMEEIIMSQDTLNSFALSLARELLLHKVDKFHSAAEESERFAPIDEICMKANIGNAPDIEKIEEAIKKVNNKLKWLRQIEAVEPETCLEYKIKKDEHEGCRLRVEKVGDKGLVLLVFEK